MVARWWRMVARSLLVVMLLPCTVLGVALSGVARAAARTSLLTTRRAAAVAVMRVSPTTLIDPTFLNDSVFVRGIEEAQGVKLTHCLAAGQYRQAGDLVDANPDTFRGSLRTLGVEESHQDALCTWSTEQRQARDRSLPGRTCTLDSRPGRQTPLFREPCSGRHQSRPV